MLAGAGEGWVGFQHLAGPSRASRGELLPQDFQAETAGWGLVNP